MKTQRNKPLRVVKIVNLQSRKQLALAKIRQLTEKILLCLKKQVELHLVFVDDPQIKRINRLYHKQDRYTDVLAFAKPSQWPHLPNHLLYLGEVIISVDRILEYADRFKVSPDEELIRYVIHGILHLLGERDKKSGERRKMFGRQEKLIENLKPVSRLIS